MNIKKLNFYATNLNLVNIIIGYTFFVSLLMPFTSNQIDASQVITIPFRAFSLFLSLFVILINLKSKNKLTIPVFIFFLFWIVVMLRMFYDLEIRSEFYVLTKDKSRIWLIAVAGCFIPMISIFKSIKVINFDYSLKLLFSGCVIILIPSILFSLENLDEGYRETGNAALDPITFAMSGIMLSILSLYKIVTQQNKNNLSFILNLIFCFLGLFLALKTGSRGPVLAFITIIFLWYSIKKKKGIFFFSLLLIPIYLAWNFISILILIIAPLFGNRLIQGLSGEDMSVLARQESYLWFINQIIEYPLFGSQFARLGNGTYPGYSHSIILDILLGFGIFGLVVFLYCVYKGFFNFKINIKQNNSYWVGLIMLQFLLVSLVSGAFYSDPPLNCLIIITLLLPSSIESKIFKYSK
jgi:O-antigen ligase